MKVNQRELYGAAVLELQGKLTGGPEAETFRNIFKELVNDGKMNIIVNLKKVDWINSTGALQPLGPKANSRVPQYEDLVGAAAEAAFEDRENYRAYGHANFGDRYTEWSWSNNEYDPPLGGTVEFLRGGDPRWAVLARQATRHLTRPAETHRPGSCPLRPQRSTSPCW